MKRFLSFVTALLLCAALALPAFAVTYPAGIDESRPRVDDGAGLLTQTQTDELEAYAREIVAQYEMDIILLTRRGISEAPRDYAEDYFEDGGYGWREEETEDITTGSGMILFVEMQERDVLVATKGVAQSVFRDGVWEQLITAIKPDLSGERYYEAFKRFLDEAAARLEDHANGAGIYADPDAPYNQGHYGENGEYIYGSPGTDSPFNMTIFVAALLLGLIIAWVAVSNMKKKHNTIRTAAAAGEYQYGFNLTERQDIFLYSNTTCVRLPEPTTTHSSGGGFSGGGSHTSSSGSSFGGGGSKF